MFLDVTSEDISTREALFTKCTLERAFACIYRIESIFARDVWQLYQYARLRSWR
jgi:hypothetical protein